AVAFLGILSILWAVRGQTARHRWRERIWTSVLGALRSPYQFDMRVNESWLRLARADVEDASTILGRAFAAGEQTRTLDVQRTVRATVRAGSFPRLIFRARRVAHPIVVFQDVCRDMRLSRTKVEGFLVDLRRQGIAIERWYFDGDLRSVGHRPYRPELRIDDLLRQRPDRAIMIISTGSALGVML